MAIEPLSFERRARRPAGLAMVGVALAALLGLIFALDAHPVIVALFALLVAPALWDVIRDSHASIHLDETTFRWQSGARKGAVPFEEIDEAVLSTTLDFSQRASLRLKDGRRQRIPPECLPGGRVLDVALTERGVANRRSLFSF
ncbi:MAG: hypothetical protein KJO15_16210 [Alphaproteobacteria bacterium]|nr:hypothetical protein [Alphaproteobacteria bacterium]